MTIDPFQLYDWIAKLGFPGAMGVFIWMLYTRRLHWHSELVDLKESLTKRCAEIQQQMTLEYERMETYLKDRVEELLEEKNEFKVMVIGTQRVAAKSMDLLSEKKKTDNVG